MIVGRVYVVDTTLATPQKEKLTICVCAGRNLFLWINTKPRPHGVGQMPLKGTDHPALTHDCYLDCSRLTTFSPSELNGAKERDSISRELAQRIIQFLTENPPKTLIGAHLKLVTENLNAIQ